MNSKKFINNCLTFFIRLFAINLICFLIWIFIFAISNTVIVRIILQLLFLIIVFFITYSFFHKLGDSDAALVNTGYYKKNILKGFWIGSLSTLPFIISGIFLVLSKLSLFSENFVAFYRMSNSTYFPFNYSILPVTLEIFEISWSKVVLSLSTLLIIPIIAAFAYNLGLIRFYFSEKLLYKEVDSE